MTAMALPVVNGVWCGTRCGACARSAAVVAVAAETWVVIRCCCRTSSAQSQIARLRLMLRLLLPFPLLQLLLLADFVAQPAARSCCGENCLSCCH